MKATYLAIVLATIGLWTESLQSAPKKNFDDLAGTYQGTAIFVDNGDEFYFGRAEAVIVPKRGGERATVVVNATLFVNDDVYYYTGSFAFGGNGKMVVWLPLLGFDNDGGMTAGTFRFGRKAFWFAAVNSQDPDLVAVGRCAFRFTKKKRILNFSYNAFYNGNPEVGFNVKLKSRIPNAINGETLVNVP